MPYPSKWNVVSITIYIVLAASVYFSFKYVPILWKRNQLETLVKDYSYVAKGRSDEYVRERLISAGTTELNITIEEEHILIHRLTDQIRIRVVWTPTITFLFHRSVQLHFAVVRETIFY